MPTSNPSLEERIYTVQRKLTLIIASATNDLDVVDPEEISAAIAECAREASDLLQPIRDFAPTEAMN